MKVQKDPTCESHLVEYNSIYLILARSLDYKADKLHH